MENNVPQHLVNDRNVERVLKGAMSQAVYETVYGHYIPHEYKRRRGQGGLGDTRLMQITDAILKDGKFHIIFQNLAKGNDTLNGEYLAETIENGIKENWEKTGVWSEPRPFIQDTYRKILENPQPLMDAVKKAFVKCGFKVK